MRAYTRHHFSVQKNGALYTKESMAFFNRNNTPKNAKKGRKNPLPEIGMPGGSPFWGNFLTTLLVFLLVATVYTYVVGQGKKANELALSEVAAKVMNDEVVSITVSGDELTVTTESEEEFKSKKEVGTALSESLRNYGVPAEKLAAVKIEVKNESGFSFWFFNLAPFLIPLVFIGFFLWFLTRQVKGTGMQAFTFGQSKARVIDPSDTTQRVTFADVAGAKEAKEELTEIVDFLRNPKKFLDIGARIPKGLLLMGAPGTGKCVTGDTLLLTNKGHIPIDEVPKYFTVRKDSTVEGLDVISLNPKTTKFDSAAASHWYELGEQETKILTTELGSRIEGTHEHPVVVLDETGSFLFKRLDEIAEGEHVVMSRGANVYGSYTKIPTPDAAYLLGLLVGDGCLTVKDRINFTTADAEVIASVQQITQSLFASGFSKTSSRLYDYELRSFAAKSKLREWGLEETYARNKKVPEWVRIAPKPFVVAFLRGLFDSDGYVEKTGSIGLSSASKKLIEEVHALLLNMGMVARIYERKKRYNGQIQFYLTIYGDFVELFEREISFAVVRKKEALTRLISRQRNTNVNLVPLQNRAIASVWQHAVAEAPRDREFYSQSLYKNVKRYMSGERTFIAGATALAPALVYAPEVAYLKRLASGDFFFTRVEKIEHGKARVYDLTVPHVHNFVANGFINHNTLLARAVAGEAGVPFFSISGSEFVEMFVGVGASRVRDLFRMAKKAAPAIIFVDEIDAVGRVRGTGVGGGNDEREQTLNQILVEMDGFEPNEKVIVMAATNRPDVLDPALLRPGRFDRRVVIDLPDRNDREHILQVHARKKPLGEDVNLRTIAERTPGFSGADLYSLMNEGAILAARENRKKVSQYDLIRSIEKVMLGPERKSHVLSRKEKEITAYHEGGHALVASVLPYADPVHKISIISRGRAAGYTLKLPFEDKRMQSKKQFLDDIAVSLGGYVAERLVFDDLTTGPSNDLQVLSALARDMVTKYGMSEKMGPVALEGEGGRTLFGAGVGDKEYSQKISAEIDAEVAKIIDDAYKKAEHVLKMHRKALDVLAAKLMEVETLERKEFEEILIAHGIVPKKAEVISEIPEGIGHAG